MIETRLGWPLVMAWLLAGLLTGQTTNAATTAELVIGYVEIASDARYQPRRHYTSPEPVSAPRPFAGAEVALRDSAIQGRSVGVTLSIDRFAAESAAAAADWIARGGTSGATRLVLIDADAASIEEIARRTRDSDSVLFNVSAPDDLLRGERCERHLLHVLPSDAMLADALLQYLVSRRWRDILVLTGPGPRDALVTAAFRRAAERFGVRVVAVRDFVLGNDPRDRDRNNVALLTAGDDYDVVFVADEDGEFARYVAYQTARPRPVVGAEGLSAAAWSWTWERHGAPQLARRFERHAGRRMQSGDWAAWAATRAIVEALVRTRSTDVEVLAEYVRSDALNLDGYKGNPLSFRPWDGQLRQPVLLHTHDAVVARAPVEGFLHPTHNLDTLGYDRPESRCKR